jgi:type II secretory pathway pseudopilin PulG
MSRAGFSLIEALVALIVAAMALASVLELQRQLADGQARYQRSLTLAGLERDAMTLTADINPTERPDGGALLPGGRSLSWVAQPLGSPTLNTGSARSGRAFELRLYLLTIQIRDAGGGPLGQFTYDRVGWRRLDAPAPYVPPPSLTRPPSTAAGPFGANGPQL